MTVNLDSLDQYVIFLSICAKDTIVERVENVFVCPIRHQFAVVNQDSLEPDVNRNVHQEEPEFTVLCHYQNRFALETTVHAITTENAFSVSVNVHLNSSVIAVNIVERKSIFSMREPSHVKRVLV